MIDESRVTSEVVGRIVERVRLAAAAPRGRPLEEVVNETLYRERERLKRAKGERAQADRAFYGRLQHELPRASSVHQQQLLQDVVGRYAGEISGHFDERVYAVSTRALPLALGGLLSSLSPRRVLEERQLVSNVDTQLVLEGDIAHLRRLHERGTLLMVPTHSSNLDSVLMGYAIYRMGLPPVTYGAGLNLFSNPLIGFFMRHLGAYTVDRLKTDPLYRDVLKEYATVTLENGQDNLFFPGGTRSRSGALERRLKKGLLGTGLTAFKNNLFHRKDKPRIFIVPVTISYPLVLEAATLIEDFLADSGKSRYIIVDDEFSQLRRWVSFMKGLLELDLRIHVRVGRGLDPFGNPVDDDGRSLDPRGRELDPARYLMARGEVVEDAVRDAEYTKELAAAIVRAFECENVVQPTNAVAFAFFDLLRRRERQPDLYRLLRTLGPDVSVPQPDLERDLERLLAELHRLADAGRIRLAPVVAANDVREVLRSALGTFGTYHSTPVIERRGVRVHVGDAKLVYFYRNRLEGYGLLGAPDLLPRRRDA